MTGIELAVRPRLYTAARGTGIGPELRFRVHDLRRPFDMLKERKHPMALVRHFLSRFFHDYFPDFLRLSSNSKIRELTNWLYE